MGGAANERGLIMMIRRPGAICNRQGERHRRLDQDNRQVIVPVLNNMVEFSI